MATPPPVTSEPSPSAPATPPLATAFWQVLAAVSRLLPPKPSESICDPACGTGGFLFTAHNHIVDRNKNLTRDELKHLKEKAFTGYELVQATARVCAIIAE